METLVINSTNQSSAVSLLKQGGKYFIITVDVTFPKGITIIGADSVLCFRGGMFRSALSSILYFNSCSIIAGAYPIFDKRVSVEDFANSEVKAEWFKSAEDKSDHEFINRALEAANGASVVLEYKTYTLLDSIKFKHSNSIRQTLICPGTLVINNPNKEVPAIDITTSEVTLKINKIVGTETSDGYSGVGIKFNDYIAHSDIEVNGMSKLYMGFMVRPDVRGSHVDHPEKDSGGVQYCRIKFNTISAYYCFYIDVFSTAQYLEMPEDKVIELKNVYSKLDTMSLKPLNWFNENQIIGGLMEGEYGIYVVAPNEFKIEGYESSKNPINPDKVDNALNGLKFDNISFERITGLALRIRSMNRSCFLNMQMFNSMPGGAANVAGNFTPWIDLDYIMEVRMTFNSYVMPAHFKAGDYCRNCYISGAIIDNLGHYTTHFDTLGIDTLYGNDNGILTQKSQMFVTNSIVPYNMTKYIKVSNNETKYIKDILPNLNEGSSSAVAIDLRVLSSAVNIEVSEQKTFTLNLAGLDIFAPCLYSIYVNIKSGAELLLTTSDTLRIEEVQSNGTTLYVSSKSITDTGMYYLQWLSNWKVRITKA